MTVGRPHPEGASGLDTSALDAEQFEGRHSRPKPDVSETEALELWLDPAREFKRNQSGHPEFRWLLEGPTASGRWVRLIIECTPELYARDQARVVTGMGS